MPSGKSSHSLRRAAWLALGLCALGWAQGPASTGSPNAVATIPGMPPVIDPANLYSEIAAGKIARPSPATCRVSTSRTCSPTTST